MKTSTAAKLQVRKRNMRSRGDRGIALVTTLLLLMLLSAVTIGMVISASSDELISGYNRNIRSSFYAADSGLNVARQYLQNQIIAAVPTTVTNPTVMPLTSSNFTAAVSNATSSYGSSSYTSLNTGSASNSWPSKFKLTTITLTPVATGTPAGCHVYGTTSNVQDNCNTPCLGGGTYCSDQIQRYTYSYQYSLAAMGQSRASEQTTLTDMGNLNFNVPIQQTGTTTSFAAYGFFVNHYNICDGSTLVPGTITGPVFSNGTWNFGTSGSYIFTDTVGAALSNFGYQFSSTCKQSSACSSSSGSTTIRPTFQGGYQLGQHTIDLPPNSYNQQRAVLDGIGDCPSTGSCTPQTLMNDVLKLANSTSYPSSGTPSSGVYLPYETDSASCGSASPPCIKGGGVFVKGNATVTLAATTGSGTLNGYPVTGHPLQVITIVQGSTTTTITMDLDTTAPKTTIVSGGSATTVNGVPTQYNSAGVAQREAAMIYVDGNITSLKGPGSGGAAIQDHSAMTVTADGDITVTDDILYKTKPVTTTQNEIAGAPPSTVIPGHDLGQALGIFTNTGDIQLDNCSGCGNMEIDASLATISSQPGADGGLINIGSKIDTLTIVGGRIQNEIKNINSTTRNVIFDRRYLNNGFAPPWFPSTMIISNGSLQPEPDSNGRPTAVAE